MQNLLYVYKSMGIIVQNGWRATAIFIAIIIMLSSLFISRALLSCSIGAFVALTIVHAQLKEQLLRFVKSPLLLSLSLLFFIPFVSGLWSQDKLTWLQVVQTKLPLLLLPVGFAGSWQLRARQWDIIALIFLSLTFLACCWSLWFYFDDIATVTESYLRAKTIPTALGNDHVRFSWLVVIAILLSLHQLIHNGQVRNKWSYGVFAAVFVIYLHVLSARMGLVMFYILLPVFLLQLLRKKHSRKFFLLTGIAIVVLFLCWLKIPTLQNKIRYSKYDISFINQGHIVAGTSDANRAISLQAGWDILRYYPLGVGAGDVRRAVNEWYAWERPDITENNKLYPSSEWIVYGNFAGWPGVLFFTTILIVPFFIRVSRFRLSWIMLNAIAICAFILETTLEIQFGIFIYCFTVLWFWKCFNADPDL